jgi:regulatory protein
MFTGSDADVQRRRRPTQDPESPPRPGSTVAIATRLLGRRDHTIAELRAALVDRGHAIDEVESAIDRFASDGSLNDRRVALAHVRRASQIKGRGRVRIERELAARGISSEIVGEALAAMADDDEVAALERILIRKRVPAVLGMPERRRLFQQLLRRGFRADLIARALKFRPDADT